MADLMHPHAPHADASTTPIVFRFLPAVEGDDDGPPSHLVVGIQPHRGKARHTWFVHKADAYTIDTYPIEALPKSIVDVLRHAVTQPEYTGKRWFSNATPEEVAWIRTHGSHVEKVPR